jgi:hypothetical protein
MSIFIYAIQSQMNSTLESGCCDLDCDYDLCDSRTTSYERHVSISTSVKHQVVYDAGNDSEPLYGKPDRHI